MAKAKKAADKAAKPSPEPNAHLIVVGNLKGGSGKSTIAFNLAVWLAANGHAVRLVDLDPQKTLTDLVAVRGELDFSPTLAPPVDRLDALEGGGDWIIVDVGAADMPGMLRALGRADAVLVPVIPGQADVWATQRFLKIIDRERLGHCGIRLFVNRADPVDQARETREAVVALEAMAGLLDGVSVLPVKLARRIVFCRSLSEGAAVFEIEPKSKAADEFERLARLVVEGVTKGEKAADGRKRKGS